MKTPARKDLNLRAAELTAGGPLARGKFNQLCEECPAQNLKINFVREQLKWYREQKSAGRSLPSVNFSRKRKECGRGAQKFTTEIAAKLIEINNANCGKLSFKRLAGKLHDEGI